MYLKRKVDTILSEWHENPSRKPLIIKGARQVGKTESIMRFAKGCYDNIIYINFGSIDKLFNYIINCSTASFSEI